MSDTSLLSLAMRVKDTVTNHIYHALNPDEEPDESDTSLLSMAIHLKNKVTRQLAQAVAPKEFPSDHDAVPFVNAPVTSTAPADKPYTGNARMDRILNRFTSIGSSFGYLFLSFLLSVFIVNEMIMYPVIIRLVFFLFTFMMCYSFTSYTTGITMYYVIRAIYYRFVDTESKKKSLPTIFSWLPLYYSEPITEEGFGPSLRKIARFLFCTYPFDTKRDVMLKEKMEAYKTELKDSFPYYTHVEEEKEIKELYSSMVEYIDTLHGGKRIGQPMPMANVATAAAVALLGKKADVSVSNTATAVALTIAEMDKKEAPVNDMAARIQDLYTGHVETSEQKKRREGQEKAGLPTLSEMIARPNPEDADALRVRKQVWDQYQANQATAEQKDYEREEKKYKKEYDAYSVSSTEERERMKKEGTVPVMPVPPRPMPPVMIPTRLQSNGKTKPVGQIDNAQVVEKVEQFYEQQKKKEAERAMQNAEEAAKWAAPAPSVITDNLPPVVSQA